MMKRLLLLFALALLAMAVPATQAQSDGSAQRINAYLDDLEARGFSGVVLIGHGGDVSTTAMGFADREAGLPVNADTVFDIGSITKQFTGAAILRLEMDGSLSVEDPLSTYLPDLPADKGAITLHQLLTHTAGLPGSLGRDYDPIGRSEFIDLFAATPLDFEPGKHYQYSNVGYSILAAVIEIVSGQTYENYLAEALFAPAGMTITGYLLPDWDLETIAVGYEGGDVFGRPNAQRWADDGPGWHLRGNGGILSTAGDMFRWHQALLGNTILDEAAKRKLYSPHTEEGPGSDTYYGYGWALFPTLFDTTLVTHNGGNGIFFADFLRFLDEDIIVFLATNAMQDEFDATAFELANLVLDTNIIDPMMFAEGGPSCAPESLAALEALPVLDTFPVTDAGTTAQMLLDLLNDDDESARREFATNHVSEALAGGLSVDELSWAIGQLQNELGGLAIGRIAQESDLLFHVTLVGEDDLWVILSLQFSEEAPTKVFCVEITN